MDRRTPSIKKSLAGWLKQVNEWKSRHPLRYRDDGKLKPQYVIEQIDEAMKLGTNQPMGPLALADFIGLDTCLAILNVLHEGLGDPKYRPCPLLKQYVSASLLGKKTSRGFFSY